MVVDDAAQFHSLPASVATARAYQAQARRDYRGSVRYGQQALALLPARDYLRRGPAAALLGLAQWASGDLDAAYATLAEAMANFQQAGNLHFAISGTYGLADIRIAQGRLRDAAATYRRALQLVASRPGAVLRGIADLHLGLSEIAEEQGDWAAARLHLGRSEELGDAAALPDWRYRLYRLQARSRVTEGDFAGALALLDAAEQHFHRTPVPDFRPLAAERARVWLAQGRLADAQRWALEQGLAADDELSFLREFDHITLARVLLAEYGRDHAPQVIGAALRLLARLGHAAAAAGRFGSAIEIRLLEALAHQAQGDRGAASGALDAALRLAEPEGYIRVFLDLGPPLADLLAAAARQQLPSPYLQQLLAACAAPASSPPMVQPAATAASAPLAEPLSERERDVLRLLATDASGPELAGRLVVSVNTLRTHTKNIYAKLGVNNRRAAVRRAQDLGLI